MAWVFCPLLSFVFSVNVLQHDSCIFNGHATCLCPQVWYDRNTFKGHESGNTPHWAFHIAQFKYRSLCECIYACRRGFPVVEVMVKVWLRARQSGVSYGFLPGSTPYVAARLHEPGQPSPCQQQSLHPPKQKADVLKVGSFLGSMSWTFDFTLRYFTSSLLQWMHTP